MAKTRRAYTGGAASTTTSSVIASSGTTSFTITAYTGWPYGSAPFHVVVEPGTANEEKILVTRTGSTDTTINVYATPSVAANRGADGTSAVAHSSGSTVFPVFTALDADEANELASTMTSKGDILTHDSSSFERLAVGTNDYALVADSGEATGLKWGQIQTAGLADDAVTTAKIDDGAVDTAQLADDAVTSPKISLAYADSSARATALPSPAEGDLSYLQDTNSVEVYDGSSWAAVGQAGGKILQVVSTFVDTVFSTSSTSFVDVTGHTATITPTAATSKIFVVYSCMTYHNSTGRVRMLNLVRDGSNICQPASGTLPATMNPYLASSLGVQHAVVNFLDSPATTSAVVYKIQLKTDAGTVYVGGDSSSVLTAPSNLTLMEVSA